MCESDINFQIISLKIFEKTIILARIKFSLGWHSFLYMSDYCRSSLEVPMPFLLSQGLAYYLQKGLQLCSKLSFSSCVKYSASAILCAQLWWFLCIPFCRSPALQYRGAVLNFFCGKTHFLIGIWAEIDG